MALKYITIETKMKANVVNQPFVLAYTTDPPIMNEPQMNRTKALSLGYSLRDL